MVFIDDDSLMRFTWFFAAQINGITLLTYNHPDAFIREIEQFNKSTLIYIDSDLGEDVPGEQYAKKIYQLGFHEIYLSTAYPADKYSNMPWVKAIVGKTPPF